MNDGHRNDTIGEFKTIGSFQMQPEEPAAASRTPSRAAPDETIGEMETQSEDGRIVLAGRYVVVKRLGSVWLAKHPVTQRQWRSVMGYNPSGRKGDDLPVERVSLERCAKILREMPGSGNHVALADGSAMGIRVPGGQRGTIRYDGTAGRHGMA